MDKNFSEISHLSPRYRLMAQKEVGKVGELKWRQGAVHYAPRMCGSTLHGRVIKKKKKLTSD